MSMVGKNIAEVIRKIEEACHSKSLNIRQTRLVAVSKEKPVELIIEAYLAGQRYFGENKIVDLYKKSHSQRILIECPDIKWHFIGKIQSNKIKKLVEVKNLVTVETVDSCEHALKLDTAWGNLHSTPLNIFVQLSDKSGINPSEVLDLYDYIHKNCHFINFSGLMCIGEYGIDTSRNSNPDFLKLLECRSNLAQSIGKSVNDFELSMGMSSDYEHAVQLGSTNVRVGSSIFGSR